MLHGVSSCGQQKVTPTPPGNVYLSGSHDQEQIKGGKGAGERHRSSPYPAGFASPAPQSQVQEATQMDAASDAGSTTASNPSSAPHTDSIVGALKMALEGYGCATATDLNNHKLAFDAKLQLQDDKIESNKRDADGKFASLEDANKKLQETIEQLSKAIDGHVTKTADTNDSRSFNDPLINKDDEFITRFVHVRGWAPHGSDREDKIRKVGAIAVASTLRAMLPQQFQRHVTHCEPYALNHEISFKVHGGRMGCEKIK